MKQIVRSPQQLGAILQALRQEQGVTQSELSSITGVRQELISIIERGHPGAKLSSILSLLAALDLELVIQPRTRTSAADIQDIF